MEVFCNSFYQRCITQAQYNDINYFKKQPYSNAIQLYFIECGYPQDQWTNPPPPKVLELIESRYLGLARYYWNFLFYNLPPLIHFTDLYRFDLFHIRPLYELFIKISESGKELLLALIIKIFYRRMRSEPDFVREYPTETENLLKDEYANIYLNMAKIAIDYIEYIDRHFDVRVSLSTRGKTLRIMIEEWKKYLIEKNEAVYSIIYDSRHGKPYYTYYGITKRFRYFHWFLWLILSKGEGSCDKTVKLIFSPK